ncbi:MAG: hypothetical protein WCH46_05820 [bacterium]
MTLFKKYRLIPLLGIAIYLFGSLTPDKSSAQETKELSIGLGGGASFGVNEAHDKTLHFAGRVTLLYWRGLGSMFTPELGLTFTTNGTPTLGGFSEYTTSMTAPDLRIRFYPFGTEDGKTLMPYIHAGVGVVIYNIKDKPYNSDPSVQVTGADPNLAIGAGLTYSINRNWMLDLNISGNPSFADNLNPATDQ